VRPSPAEVSQVAVRKQPSDRLAEEVELLSRAQTELRSGRYDTALRSLEEHARKFPRGTLAQERRATRIQALCSSGRTREADTELARLSPGSVHEGRTREICAAARKATP
jgi:outer membrane protein assembly factor BamD (BamD/ComL family)